MKNVPIQTWLSPNQLANVVTNECHPLANLQRDIHPLSESLIFTRIAGVLGPIPAVCFWQQAGVDPKMVAGQLQGPRRQTTTIQTKQTIDDKTNIFFCHSVYQGILKEAKRSVTFIWILTPTHLKIACYLTDRKRNIVHGFTIRSTHFQIQPHSCQSTRWLQDVTSPPCLLPF